MSLDAEFDAEPQWSVDHCEPIADHWVHVFRRHGTGELFSVPCPAIVVERATATYVLTDRDEVTVSEHRTRPKYRVALGYIDPTTGELRALPPEFTRLHAVDRVSLFRNSDWCGATTQSDFDAQGQDWKPPQL